jgi:ATP-dependent RNA circularization protein (DNA/RNA ligase family)
MGTKPKSKFERNFEIFDIWKKDENLNKKQRDMVMKRYGISQSRLYAIIRWCKKRIDSLEA